MREARFKNHCCKPVLSMCGIDLSKWCAGSISVINCLLDTFMRSSFRSYSPSSFFLLWHLFVFVFVIAVTAIAAMASSDNDTACNSGDSASGDSDGCDGDGVVLCCSDSGSLGLVVGAAAGAFFYHSWYVGHSHSLIVILNHTVRITMMTLYFLFSDNDNMS